MVSRLSAEDQYLVERKLFSFSFSRKVSEERMDGRLCA